MNFKPFMLFASLVLFGCLGQDVPPSPGDHVLGTETLITGCVGDTPENLRDCVFLYPVDSSLITENEMTSMQEHIGQSDIVGGHFARFNRQALKSDSAFFVISPDVSYRMRNIVVTRTDSGDSGESYEWTAGQGGTLPGNLWIFINKDGTFHGVIHKYDISGNSSGLGIIYELEHSVFWDPIFGGNIDP